MNDDQPVTGMKLKSQLDEALDRILHAVGAEFSTFRFEVNARFSAIERHLEIVDRRLDRIGESLSAITRWADNTAH